jgi:hypothetical protein
MSLRDQVVASFSDRTARFTTPCLLKNTFPGCVFVRAVQTLTQQVSAKHKAVWREIRQRYASHVRDTYQVL